MYEKVVSGHLEAGGREVYLLRIIFDTADVGARTRMTEEGRGGSRFEVGSGGKRGS